MESAAHHMNIHETLRNMKKGNAEFDEKYDLFAKKYLITD